MEIGSRTKYQKEQRDKTQDPIHFSLDGMNGAVRLVILIVIGWAVYQFRMTIFILLTLIFNSFVQFLGSFGVINQETFYLIMTKQNALFSDSQFVTLLVDYGALVSIIGFIDKFFSGFFPSVFIQMEKVRHLIPTFPFSGLIKIVLLIGEILFRIIWLFSSSVIQFVTSIFNFMFVLLYKLAIPLHRLTSRAVDNTHVTLGEASSKIDSTSKRWEKTDK